jgi:hypothetical protein
LDHHPVSSEQAIQSPLITTDREEVELVSKAGPICVVVLKDILTQSGGAKA